MNQSTFQRFDLEGNPVNWPGVPGPNELQNITFENGPAWAFSDTFTLTCPNGETTAPIEYGAESQEISAHIKAGLEAKCGGTFFVEGGFFNQRVSFEGTFAETNVPKMTCTRVTGAGNCEINSEQNGASGTNALHVECFQFSCSSIAVDNSGGPNQGVIYVGTSSGGFGGHVQVFLPDGTNVGPITNIPGDPVYGTEAPCGVAVDSDGNLYVTHSEGQIAFTFVDRYAPLEWATHHQQTVPATGTIRPLDFNSPCRTAVDSDKSLVISSGSGGETGILHRFAPDSFGPPEEPFTPGTSSSIISGARGPAVDPSNDDIYVGLSGKIARFDSSDSLIEEFGEGELENEVGAVAVNGQSGKIYVTDGRFGPREIKIYKSIPVPDALTQDATGVLHSEAVLHGHIDPAGAGEITGCEFQYVKDSLYNASKFASATSVPCSPGPPQASATDVSASISGLAIEEGFHFRLRATDANGTSNGAVKTFKTRSVLDIKTEAATNVAPRSVTLNGSFTGESQPTEYFYEWGTNQSYGNLTPTQTLPSPSGATQAPQALPGLELETLYHYRIIAKNSLGTSKGEDMTFTTLPAVTALETKPATSLDLESITLNAEFHGDGLDTKYYFEYGLTTAEENETPEEDAGVTSGATPIAFELEEFNGFRTYHYRIVAINSFGKTKGQEMTFVAPDPLKPGIEGTRTRLDHADHGDRLDRCQPEPLGNDLPLRVGRNAGIRDPDLVRRTDRRPRRRTDSGRRGTHRPDARDGLSLPGGRGELQGDDERRRRDFHHPRPAPDRLDRLRIGGQDECALQRPRIRRGKPDESQLPVRDHHRLRPGHGRGRDRRRTAFPQSRRRRQQPDPGHHLPLPDRRDQPVRDDLRARSDLHHRGGTAGPEAIGRMR